MGGKTTRCCIASMIFLSAYVNYSVRVNMAVSIIAIVSSTIENIPECVETRDIGKYEENVPHYGRRYDWNEHIQGIILGSYFYGYLPALLLSKLLVVKVGPLRTIYWAQVIAAAANYASVHAVTGHYTLLIATRVVVGICGGLVYPALQQLISLWAPPNEKKKFAGALMGNTLGTCIAWPVVGIITEAFGWEWGFYFISLQLIVQSILFWIICADSPEEHKWISETEKNYIIKAQAEGINKNKGEVPYRKILLSRAFWVLSICHFGNLWGLYLQLSSIPKFLYEIVGFSLSISGSLGVLPHLIRLFFGMAFGFFGEFLHKKGIPNGCIRIFFIIFSHIIPGLALIAISFVKCDWMLIVALLTSSMAINGAAVITNLSNPQDLAPNFAGTIFSMISFIGGYAGLITPSVTAVFINDNNRLRQWTMNFRVGGGVYIFCGVFFMLFCSVKQQKWNEKNDVNDQVIQLNELNDQAKRSS